MGRNFLAMPPLLKLLTASAFVVLLFVVGSAFRNSGIEVFGRQVSSANWWSSGAGLVTLIAGAILAASAILMLSRSRYGRPTYILGWVALDISILLISRITGTEVATAIPALISNVVITGVLGAYLYKSKAISHYFYPTS